MTDEGATIRRTLATIKRRGEFTLEQIDRIWRMTDQLEEKYIDRLTMYDRLNERIDKFLEKVYEA